VLTQPDAGLDTTAYVALAERVLGGDPGLGPGLYFLSPLYIYFLAAVLAVWHSFTAVRLLQIVLGTGTVALVFVSADGWFGRRAGDAQKQRRVRSSYSLLGLPAFLPEGHRDVRAEHALPPLFRFEVQRPRLQQIGQRDHPGQASVLPAHNRKAGQPRFGHTVD